MDPTAPALTCTFAAPAALYARLSQNPNGTKDSVPTQLRLGHQRAALLWPGRALVEFSDDDLSADDDTYRPGYEAMLAAIERGEVGDVLCRVQARISRGKLVWPRFQVTCLAAGIEELTTWEQGTVSLREGEDIAGDVTNLFNVHHRVTTKLGVRSTLGLRARDGRPGGGRPYGYKHEREAGVSRLVVVPDQAAVIERMAKWVLAGWSLAGIARQLNAEGIKTKLGKEWTTGRVRVVVTNPVVTGLRVYQGEVVGEGNWPPIIDRPTYHALRATLAQPRTVTTNGHQRIVKGTRRPARRHLLTGGIARCGPCGTALVAQMKKRAGSGLVEAVYYCTTARGGCGKAWINGERLEALAVEGSPEHGIVGLLEWLTAPGHLAAMAADDADAAEREAIAVEREALAQRKADTVAEVVGGRMTPGMGSEVEKGILDEMAALDRRQADLLPLAPALALDGDDVAHGWAETPLDQRRAILAAVRARVVVGPALKRRWSPEAERVTVTFG